MAEVREAAEKIDAKSVEAWIAARGRGFKLHADGLTALIQAGVAESIVDVLVAGHIPGVFLDRHGTRGRVVNGEGYTQDTSSGSPDSGGPAGDSSGSSGGSRTAKPRGGETLFE